MTCGLFKHWFKSSKASVYWITILAASPAWYVLATMLAFIGIQLSATFTF